MRSVGIGALGLIGGVLLGVILQDLLAGALISRPGSPTGLGRGLGALLPLLGLLGIGAAIWLDRRRRE